MHIPLQRQIDPAARHLEESVPAGALCITFDVHRAEVSFEPRPGPHGDYRTTIDQRAAHLGTTAKLDFLNAGTCMYSAEAAVDGTGVTLVALSVNLTPRPRAASCPVLPIRGRRRLC
ncbi:hypothetical protein AB0J01_27870 [Streptomyces sp. NPDC050204]|uniref:hypothetical protein n=1 Tax=Streptomyces sp. NPDC050204 TaxID=3155514 RepID=UPI003447846A